MTYSAFHLFEYYLAYFNMSPIPPSPENHSARFFMRLFTRSTLLRAGFSFACPAYIFYPVFPVVHIKQSMSFSPLFPNQR